MVETWILQGYAYKAYSRDVQNAANFSSAVPLTTRNDRTCVTHTLTFPRRYPSDVTNYNAGLVTLDLMNSAASSSAVLAISRVAIGASGIWIVTGTIEALQSGSCTIGSPPIPIQVDWLQTKLGCLSNSFIASVMYWTWDDTNTTRLVDVTEA